MSSALARRPLPSRHAALLAAELAGGLAITLALAACTDAPTAARPTASTVGSPSASRSAPPPKPAAAPYTMVFQRDLYLYTMNTDGTGLTQLTTFEAAGGDWSPNGAKIAFTGGGCCQRQIYTMNRDGTGLVNLTNDGADNVGPDWSPDGSKIAYSNTGVWVINADGTGRTLLTGGAGGTGNPRWSPDGTRIVYGGLVNGSSQIFVMNADGSGAVQLTADPSSPSTDPSWSPDGTKIVFERCVAGATAYPWVCATQTDLFVMNGDGKHVVRLSNTPTANEYGGKFTPDGKKIGYFSDATGTFQIYQMNVDGSGVVDVSNSSSRDVSPDYKP